MATKNLSDRPVLRVEGLCVSYGKVEALTDASITVGEGQIVTVIGPNGAGKTTMLSAIMGLLPSRGRIEFDSVAMVAPEVETMVASGMNLVPEKRELFGEMSVEDNLVLGAFQRYRMGLRDHAQTMEEIFALFPRLRERRTQMAGTLSGGERQMLAIGRALMSRPKLLMLDEPSLGLAPLIVREVLNTADRGYVLEMGEVAVQGDARALMHDQRVIDTYLGVGGKKAPQDNTPPEAPAAPSP